MKNNKKIVSMILVFVLMLSTFTTVLAADRDLVHKETKEKKVFEEYLLDDSFIYELLVEGALEDYYVEVNEKLYNSAEVQEKFDEDPTVTLEEAVVGLDSVEEPTEELEVVKASAINKRTVEVVFNKDVTGLTAGAVTVTDPAAAVVGTPANYLISKIAGNKYRVILDADMGIGQYTFKINANAVETADKEKNALQFVTFAGSAAADTSAPIITEATYNQATKQLVVDFSKPIISGTLDRTKFTITDGTTNVALTVNESMSWSVDRMKVTITLSSSTATSVAALGENRTLSVAKDAVKGDGNVGIEAISGISIADTVVLSSASYDANTNVLTLVFNKPVKVSTFDVTKVTLKSTGAADVVLTSNEASVQTATDGTKIELKLDQNITNLVDFEKTATTGRKVNLAASAEFKSTANKAVAATTGVTVAFTADTTVPQLVSAGYNDTTKILTLNFSEPVLVRNNANAASATYNNNVKITKTQNAEAEKTLNADRIEPANIADQSYHSTVRFKATASGFDAAANDIPSEKSGLYFPLGAFVDASGNKIAAVLANSPLAINYVNQNDPKLDTNFNTVGYKQLSQSKVQVQFDIKVAAATANNAANYEVKAAGQDAIAVSSAVLAADGKTVTLNLASDATAGLNYEIKATGVTSVYGIPVAALGTKVTWLVTTFVDNTAPALTAAKFADVNGNYTIDANDTITLTYSMPIQVTTVTADHFKVRDSGNTAYRSVPFGNGATFAKVNEDQIIITLGTAPTIVFTDRIEQQSTPAIKSANGVNVAGVAQGSGVAVANPDTTKPLILTATYADANSDGKVSEGDTIVFTFSKDMKTSVAAGKLIADVKNADNTGSLNASAGVNLGTGATAEWLDARTIRVKLGGAGLQLHSAAQDYLGTATFAGGTAADNITDLWGNLLDSAQAAVTLKSNDKSRPELQSIAIVKGAANSAVTLQAGDFIRFTMSEAVNVADVAAADVTIYIGADGKDNAGNGAGVWAVQGNVITYTVVAADQGAGAEPWNAINLQNISTITINAAGADKIKDASGNVARTPAGFGLAPTVPTP